VAGTERGAAADPAVLRVGLLGVVLAFAPLTVLLDVGGGALGDDFGRRAWLFASDLPLAALVVAAGPAVVRRLRTPWWVGRALALVAVLLAVAWAFHPSIEGALQVFRVAGAVVVAGTVVEASERDSWRIVLAVAAGGQAALALAQIVAGGHVGLTVLGEMDDPFYPVGDVSAPSGTLIHPYVLAAHALVAAGVLARRAVRQPGVWWLLAAGVAVAPMGFTYSRAAALGAIGLVGALATGAALGRADRRRFGLPAVVLALVLAVSAGLGADGWSGRVAQTTSAGTTSDLTTGRGELVRQALDIIGDSPITGVGPGRYVESLPEHAARNGIRKPVHNVPLLLAAEGGVLAGLAAALVLVAAGWIAVRRGWAAVALWLAFLPLLLLDHMAYTFPVGLVLLGVWTGALDSGVRGRLPSSRAARA
jgi:hypothetical protein